MKNQPKILDKIDSLMDEFYKLPDGEKSAIRRMEIGDEIKGAFLTLHDELIKKISAGKVGFRKGITQEMKEMGQIHNQVKNQDIAILKQSKKNYE